MLRTISLTNFRGFRRFELAGLGRVNLLVGENNSGKSSLLEAISLLASGGDLRGLWSLMSERGELIDESSSSVTEPELALSYLFHGYRLVDGQRLQIDARDDADHPHGVALEVRMPLPEQDAIEWSLLRRRRPEADQERTIGGLRVTQADPNGLPAARVLPIMEGGGLPRYIIRDFAVLYAQGAAPAVRMISTASLTPAEVVELADAIQLTDEENHVRQALQIIEPKIAEYRPTRVLPRSHGRGGIIVRLTGADVRVPIGNLGDGIWRLLGLALAMAATKDGVLLIDEIDTGLHYSVMVKMWRLVVESARRLNVQVFATSHSRDCYESLAEVVKPGDSTDSEVTIHRIEPARERSVVFGAQDIINAADRGIEIR